MTTTRATTTPTTQLTSGATLLTLQPLQLHLIDTFFTIHNPSRTVVPWTITDDNNLLRPTPLDGTTAPGGDSVINLKPFLPDVDSDFIASATVHYGQGKTLVARLTDYVDAGPSLSDFGAAPNLCLGGTRGVDVTAQDREGIRYAQVVWREEGADRAILANGTTAMNVVRGPGTDELLGGTVGPISRSDPGPAGVIYWHVVAFDNGNHQANDTSEHIITIDRTTTC